MTPLEFRTHFRIFEKKVFLNSCSKGALSVHVEDAYGEYLRSWREHGSPWELWVERLEDVRTRFASFLGCGSHELAISFSASTAIGSLLSAIDYEGERKRLAVTDLEFPTVAHNLLVQQKRGAEIVWVRSEEGRLPASTYREALDERVRIVPVTHVCFRNGYRQDLEAVVKACSDVGAWSLVDDYQSTGTVPVDVHALGCDFFVTGTLKYLLGSSGLALMYVREGLLDQLEPTVTGWFGQEKPFDFDVERATYHASARRFETGTPPNPNLYAALAGLSLLEDVDPIAVGSHVEHLGARLIEGARKLGVPVLTPESPGHRGPLVVLGFPDPAAANRAVEELARQDIVVSARGAGLRVSFHYYNVDEDVDALLAVLKKSPEWFDTFDNRED